MTDDALWYKDAVIYEVHVRAFCDSDGDGVGDFRGLAGKLDYLQDLGVTALWLLPFYPSPLRDDGYDIADYENVHPVYGTLGDFKLLLREAHRRGLRVITELVLNHTSDQHPWFQRARRAKPGSSERNFYVWSDAPDHYRDARIIFKDFEPSNWSWDAVAKAYYWHRFYAHQPDLNFDNPKVRKAMLDAVDFWLGLGVDGLRLDAVPYLYEREGTNCENLPETHAFLKQLRRHVSGKFKNRMLLAEANQWPEEAAAYFGEGDECHMAFHFPVMPRLFMSIHMEDRFPIIDILQQTPPVPESCQWALFLRNHDELTLEMVTDEDRDYMYRVYAHDPQARINLGIRRRLAPLLGNHRRRIELMNGLLFSLPGTPVIYYADEIGMGDNIYLGDRNSVRTPMQWSSDRNAGFSRSNPQQLYMPIIIDPEYHYEAINVEAQQKNPSSLLWWMKRLIGMRRRFKAFGQGTMEFLPSENRKVLSFLRRHKDECLLVVANLSRFVQCVKLDLSSMKAMVPVEVFGRTAFPPVGDAPYFLTLGPHAFYWFALEPARVAEVGNVGGMELGEVRLAVTGAWENTLRGKGKAALEACLPAFLATRRWFGGKARRVVGSRILDAVPIKGDPVQARLLRVLVEYTEGDPETYLLPVTYVSGEKADRLREASPQAILARLTVQHPGTEGGSAAEGILYDALFDRGFCLLLLDAIARRRRFNDGAGEVQGFPTRMFRKLRGPESVALEPLLIQAEQSNTSIVYGDRFVLKLFRRLDPGISPDLEIGRFLTERTSFTHLPPITGALEYQQPRGEPSTLAILSAFVPHEGDAWRYTLDTITASFERVLAHPVKLQPPAIAQGSLISLLSADLPAEAGEIIGPYLELARRLGTRTGEMHLALASDTEDPAFAPEPFTPHYQRGLYQSMRSGTRKALELLRGQLKGLPEEAREDAQRVLGLEEEILRRFKTALDRKITAMRIRVHGDYHLGQLLFTGKDFVVIDFEGEPAHPISQRRIKRSALRDVAGMLRSFHYAGTSALKNLALRPDDRLSLRPWGRFWGIWVCVEFLKSYLATAEGGPFLPKTREELEALLYFYLLEKALYELQYELNNRPDWVQVPLLGIRAILERGGAR